MRFRLALLASDHCPRAGGGRSGRGRPAGTVAGSRRRRRPLLPAAGQRRLRRARLRAATWRTTRPPAGSTAPPRSAPRRPRTLSRFDLDLRGFTVAVGHRERPRSASFTRAGQELEITPARPLRKGAPFLVAVALRRRTEVITDPDDSIEGWVPTNDGAFVVGEPQGVAGAGSRATTHPHDKATYTIRMHRPGRADRGRQRAAARAADRRRVDHVRLGQTEPMATYLATVTSASSGHRAPRRAASRCTSRVDPTRRPPRPTPVSTGSRRSSTIQRSVFGPYPFDDRGRDRRPRARTSATRWRPRPSRSSPARRTATTLAHELAHQWYGDSCRAEAAGGHLAQRGLRDVRRVAVGASTRRPAPRSRSSTHLRDAGRRHRSGGR